MFFRLRLEVKQNSSDLSVIVGKDFAELSDSKLNDLFFNMNTIFLSVSLHVINLNAVLERDEPCQCNSQDEK